LERFTEKEKSSMKTLKHIIRGCGNVPGYGDHPGTGFLCMFLILFVVAGIPEITRMIFGFIAWLVFIVPLYLLGAYSRSKEQSMQRKQS